MNAADLATLRDTGRAIREHWCNGCRKPRAHWGPHCSGMTVGDATHFHSPEWWIARQDRACERVEAELSRLREQRDFWQGTANEMAETEVPNLIKRYQKRIRAAEARCARLQQALDAMWSLACVSTEGDPWYAENEGIDVSAVYALAREALAGLDTPADPNDLNKWAAARGDTRPDTPDSQTQDPPCIESEKCEAQEWHYWRCPRHDSPDRPMR